MTDYYTPTKPSIDGMPFDSSNTPDSPAAVYIPTRINPATDDSKTPQKQVTDIRQKYGAQAGEAYSPSNPGIRIVKRKPKATTETPVPKPTTSSSTSLGKRLAPHEDVAIAALMTQPKKGILRSGQQLAKREYRRIFFADMRDLPLVSVKEIERIASIHHSNSHDFRNFDKNEGSAFCREPSPDDVDWGLLRCKRSKPLRTVLSETGRREEERIQELGLMRGAMFGVATLEDDPALTELAKKDLATYKSIVPTVSVSSESSVINTLRELPLPGRARPGEMERHPSPTYTEEHQYEQEPTIYQGVLPSEPATFQQVFQGSDSRETAYYAVEPEKSAGKPAESKPSSSNFELPANLREMLAKLRKTGILPQETAPKPEPTPAYTKPTQPAQQIYQEQQYQQGNLDSYETEAQQPFQGYIGVVTPEISAQELHQDSRNAEGWSQSGWKIQEQCSYHINRLQGCNRGDQCRYLHDEDQRQRMLESHKNRNNGRAGFGRDNEERDRGFRSDRGRRGNFRGNFRNNQHDRDFRERRGFGNRERFGNHGRNGFDQKPIDAYAPPPSYHQLQTQSSPDYNQPPPTSSNTASYNQNDQNQAGFNGYQSQMGAPAHHPKRNETDGYANKSNRRSRFDQRDDDPVVSIEDTDHRMPRRRRFDEGSAPAAARSFRSRFDERPRDQDDRARAQQWAPQ